MLIKHNDIMWKNVKIESWDKFLGIIKKFQTKEWVFRGQSNPTWELTSSFSRAYEHVQSIYFTSGKNEMSLSEEFEESLIELFKAQAHLYLNFKIPTDNLELLSLMQHYGVPTRMLDFTFSPFLATFFAIDSSKGDCAVFAINIKKLQARNLSKVNEYSKIKKDYYHNQIGSNGFVFPYEPKLKNERLIKQQGLFLIPSNTRESLDRIIAYDNDYVNNNCIKFIFTSEIRFEVLSFLKKVNINNETLFPGIDGFCKSLKYTLLESSRNLKRIH